MKYLPNYFEFQSAHFEKNVFSLCPQISHVCGGHILTDQIRFSSFSRRSIRLHPREISLNLTNWFKSCNLKQIIDNDSRKIMHVACLTPQTSLSGELKDIHWQKYHVGRKKSFDKTELIISFLKVLHV